MKGERRTYEWAIEELNVSVFTKDTDSVEIEDTDFYRTAAEMLAAVARLKRMPDTFYRTVLVMSVHDADDFMQERRYAYIMPGWSLPAEFAEGGKVPKAKHEELNRADASKYARGELAEMR